jgi:signal recognition particle receptor subunit beta
MVLFNYSTKELTAKVVYYGPGLCGKTTNLHWIHEKVPIKNKGKMLSLATETDRTLFFDFLPIELGLIRGMKTRIQLYTVPGQVFYNATRRMVLKGADAVVFVADSQEAMIDANIESMDNLRQNLEANEIDPNEVPMVLQYNKRDLPNALPIEILNDKLNERELAHFEAVAIKGLGVEETLKAVTSLVFRSLAGRYGSADDSKVITPAPPPEAVSPASAAGAALFGRPDTAPRVTAPVTTLPPSAPPRPSGSPASSFRPLNIGAGDGGSEDMLDQLNFEASDGEEGLFMDELDVEEIAFDEPPPPAPAAPRPGPSRPSAPPAASRLDPRATVASTEREAEDLRRRIAPAPRGVAPKPAADEEISIEIDSPAAPVAGPGARPAGKSAVQTIPPVTGAPTASPASQAAAQASATTDVTVPLTIAVDPGTAHVNLHLKLTIKTRPRR